METTGNFILLAVAITGYSWTCGDYKTRVTGVTGQS
jgi:hypothetical protein